MRIAVVTSGFLPVPATKGGAVENLIDIFNKQNEKYNYITPVIFSCYEERAYEYAKEYKNTEFVFIKSNKFVDAIDKSMFFIAKYILRKKNSNSYRYIFKRLHFFWKVSKYLKINNYDKVLLENHPSMYLTLKFRRNYKKYEGKYYYHCHNEFPSCYGCYNIIKNTKRFISVSEFRNNNIKDYLKLCSNKFSVLPNCCDSKFVTKQATEKEIAEIKNKHNIKPEDKVIVYIGRIIPEKGVLNLINAINLLKVKNVKLLIIGASLNSLGVKTKYEEEVENSIKEIKDKVSIVGFINHNNLYKYYSIADIDVVPSLLEDSAPLSIIEALAAGIPIITTKSGGIPEYVDRDCAYIFERDKELTNNIAEAINTLLSDEDLRIKMKKCCLERAKNFTEENYYHNFVELLK